MNIHPRQLFEIMCWTTVAAAAAAFLIAISNSFREEESHENNSGRNTVDAGSSESK